MVADSPAVLLGAVIPTAYRPPTEGAKEKLDVPVEFASASFSDLRCARTRDICLVV
jgi:hypothetical protein